jgi:hypothetical protein
VERPVAVMASTCAGWLIDAAGVDDISLGESMTRFTNSIWCGGVALVVKEVGDRVFGGGPVESDESPDEETEPAGLFDGPRDVAGGSDPSIAVPTGF